MSDITFVDGLVWNTDGCPTFVKGKLAVHAKKFAAFMEEHKTERGWVYIELRESNTGNLYACLDTFRKEPEPTDREPKEGVVYKSFIEGVVPYPQAPEGTVPF